MPTELATHAMLRLADDRVLAPTRPARLRLALTVFRLVPKDRLLAFRCADTHLHLLILGPREPAAETSRRMEIGLQRNLHLECPFRGAHLKPVTDQGHLAAAFTYILRQQSHHGIAIDPYHEAGNLPDLLGLRVCGLHTIATVRAHLPRIRSEDLREILGYVPSIPEHLHLPVVPEAAAAAVGLSALEGRTPPVHRAKASAARILRGRFKSRAVAEALGVTDRALRSLASLPAEPVLDRAVAMQAGWRVAVGPAQASTSLNRPELELGSSAGPSSRVCPARGRGERGS